MSARGKGVVTRKQLGGNPSGWMIAPALLMFVTFAVIPLAVALYLSFTKWDAISPPAWIGFQNWSKALTDPTTMSALLLSFKVIVISWVVQTPISLLLGVFVAGHQRYRAFLAALFILPLILSSAATALAFKAMLDPNFGLGASLGIPLLQQDWIGDPDLIIYVVIGIIAWQFVPFHTLLYQSGVRQIPRILYEAAEIDGAGRVAQFVHVTLPQLKYTIIASSTLIVIGSLTYFDVIFILSSGIPTPATLTLPMDMYSTGFTSGQMGAASVLAILLATIGVTIAVAMTKFSGFTRMTSQQAGL